MWLTSYMWASLSNTKPLALARQAHHLSAMSWSASDMGKATGTGRLSDDIGMTLDVTDDITTPLS